MNDSSGLKILVCCHKPFVHKLSDVYLPLDCGSALHETEHGMQRDDVGDNISDRNASFCEMTGLYWAWKNLRSDYVGLWHYRRFFDFRRRSRYPYQTFAESDATVFDSSITDEVYEQLAHGYTILPAPIWLRESLSMEYCYRHFSNDYRMLEGAVHKVSPAMFEVFSRVMNNGGGGLYPCNMFIGKRQEIDSMCDWLFSVLLEMEKHIDVSNYDSYQRRVYGFMAERLMTVWWRQRHIRQACYPVAYFCDGMSFRGFSPFVYKMQQMRFAAGNFIMRKF